MKLCPKNKINDTRLLKGIKLNFISQPDAVYNGASFDLSDYAYNSQSLMQNTLLNTYIKKGSDVLNPDRGTNLLEDSWKQYAFNEEELYHIGNFSAVESKEYINNDILSFAEDSPLASQYDFEDNEDVDIDTLIEQNEREAAALADKTPENMQEPLLKDFTLRPVFNTKYNNIIYNAIITTTKGDIIGSDYVIPELI